MIIQLLKNYTNFTYQEKMIADYIIENPNCIFENNAKELGYKVYASSSTIVRLTQKLGYKGYPDFQLNYIRENSNIRTADFPTPLVDTPIKSIPDYMAGYYDYTIKETKSMLSKESLVRIVNVIMNKKRLDFFASDINYCYIQAMCLKLNTLGIQAQAFNTINALYLRNMNPKETVTIIASHSGNNAALLEIANMLKKRKIPIIALTGRNNPELENLSNESLYISSSNGELDSIEYGLSLEYLLNVLFAAIAQKTKKS